MTAGIQTAFNKAPRFLAGKGIHRSATQIDIGLGERGRLIENIEHLNVTAGAPPRRLDHWFHHIQPDIAARALAATLQIAVEIAEATAGIDQRQARNIRRQKCAQDAKAHFLGFGRIPLHALGGFAMSVERTAIKNFRINAGHTGCAS